MKDLKEIKLNDTVYVRKDNIKDNKETGLFRIVKYCGLEWQVIAEDTETVTLLLKKVLGKELIKSIFEKTEYDSDYDVRFNSEQNIWWKDSIIRKRLNSKFLQMLNKDDLAPMTTTVWCDGVSSTTKDYVRLLTVEEIFRLPKRIKENKYKYWFWSLSPYYMSTSGYASVFIVHTSGDLNSTSVNSSAGGVAPVIKLKTEVLNKSN